MNRRAVVVIAVAFLVGCNGITYPTGPTINSPGQSGATNLLLSATPDRLPPSGGQADVSIRVIARRNGEDVGIAGAVVKLSSTEGTLSATELTTNEQGEARAQWTATTTGTIIARSGQVDGMVTVPVDAAPLTPVPPATPTPRPPLPPLPPQPPSPPTTPAPVAITLAAEPATVTAGNSVTFTADATVSNADPVRGYEWDFGDGATATTSGAVASHAYATPGAYTATVIVRTTTWANGTATAGVTVNPVAPPAPPALSVTLAADNTSVVEGATVNFTATPSGLAAGETVIAYQWDLDGNGTFNPTTTTNLQSQSYATTNLYTAKVKITTSNARTAEATRLITVRPPP